MFRRLLLTSFLALLGLPAWAFTATPILVSGTNQNINSQPQGIGTFIRFRLRNYAGFVPKVFGTGIIVQTQVDVTPVADSGTFGTPLWSNDDIVPNTCGVTGNQACTWYTVEFWNGGKITSSGNYCIPNTSPNYDLNVAVPCQTPPLPPGPIQVTNVSGGQISGTTSHVLKFIGPTTASDSEGIATGNIAALWPLGLNVGLSALQITKLSSATTGTTVYRLAAKDPTTGFARDAQSTDANSLIGITVGGAGQSTLSSIVIAGNTLCTFDNTSGVNDWVTLGTNSMCHDAGATQPVGVMSIGKVISSNGGPGTNASLDIGLPDVTSNSANTVTGGNGTVSQCNTNGAIGFYSAIGNTIGCDPSFTDDGAGNLHATSFLLNGTGGGFLFFGQGATPSLTQTNAVYFYAPASVPTSFGTAWPSAPGTIGQTLVITSVPDATHVVLGYATSACTGACLETTPPSDQTIVGSHQLINQGTEQVGFPFASFSADIQAFASDPASGTVAISGQTSGAGNIGVQGIQTGGGGGSGIFGLGEGTNSATFGGFFAAFANTTTGNPYVGTALFGQINLTVAGSLPQDVGANAAEAKIYGGTVQSLSSYITSGNQDNAGGTGGVATKSYGYNVQQAMSVGTPSAALNAAFHAADQGAGGSNYGIYLEGSTHNNLGGGQTVMGSLGLNNATGGGTTCLQADNSGAVTPTYALCGGSSSPGGSNTDLQYNNSGSFGGFTDGSSTQVLHGGRTFGSVVNADIAAATIDLTTKVTGVLPTANGGSTNGFFAVSGPASTIKTFTFPNANATVLTSNAAVTVAQGGTGIASGTSGGVLCFTGSGTLASSPALTANLVVVGGGAGVCPSTVTTPNIADASYTSLNVSGGGLLCSSTAPTISSGFGTTPSISAPNGTCSFVVVVGSGGTASTGVIGLPTALNAWNCYATDSSTMSTTVFLTKQVSSTVNSATLTNFNTSASAAAWGNGDNLRVSCFAR